MQTCVSLHQQSSRTQVQKLETCESRPILKRENQKKPRVGFGDKKKKKWIKNFMCIHFLDKVIPSVIVLFY